jgi:hypothetical protein
VTGIRHNNRYNFPAIIFGRVDRTHYYCSACGHPALCRRCAPVNFKRTRNRPSRPSIFAMLPPSLTPAATTAAWNSLLFGSSSALSL